MNDPLRLTDTNFEQEVLKSKIPVLVEFWASWCPPCKMVEPVLADLTREYDGKARIAKLHVDQNPKTAAKYQIMGVPTFILFNSGEEVQRQVGSQSKEQLNQMISQLSSHQSAADSQ